ncbi:MAG TPA: efflux RND transporter periplasmic adaptor subunit [Spongiibacteraceae bacterium]|nr:efflux RND transporter periplasmic adaptor subunit [Spongiibacteraceae bacterium]
MYFAKLALAGWLGTTFVGCGKAPEKAAMIPAVVVVEPLQRDVPVYVELVGEAQGEQDVEIRARVEGFLQSVNFTEGSYVKKDTLLYQIDPKPLQADLATQQARLTKASGDVDRFEPLYKKQAVSRQELDNALAARDAARAQVDLAKLNLGYTTIRSPIDGIVGITQVKPGNLVGRGESTLLTTVSLIDPIVFRVGISEAEYFKVAKRGPRTANSQPLDVQLELANGEIYSHKGTFAAVDRGVDAQTGTLLVKFAFANPERLIRPGQYGRVRVTAETLPNALLVPQRAIKEIQGIYQVAVVGADNKVALRTVKTGARFGDLWVISEGIKPGEKIIAEGLQRVRDGSVVTPKLEQIDTALAPPANSTPPPSSTPPANPAPPPSSTPPAKS